MGTRNRTVSALRIRNKASATTCWHQKMSLASQLHVTEVILHLRSHRFQFCTHPSIHPEEKKKQKKKISMSKEEDEKGVGVRNRHAGGRGGVRCWTWRYRSKLTETRYFFSVSTGGPPVPPPPPATTPPVVPPGTTTPPPAAPPPPDDEAGGSGLPPDVLGAVTVPLKWKPGNKIPPTNKNKKINNQFNSQ